MATLKGLKCGVCNVPVKQKVAAAPRLLVRPGIGAPQTVETSSLQLVVFLSIASCSWMCRCALTSTFSGVPRCGTGAQTTSMSRRRMTIAAGQAQSGNTATKRRLSGPPSLPPIDSNVSTNLEWRGLSGLACSFGHS